MCMLDLRLFYQLPEKHKAKRDKISFDQLTPLIQNSACELMNCVLLWEHLTHPCWRNAFLQNSGDKSATSHFSFYKKTADASAVPITATTQRLHSIFSSPELLESVRKCLAKIRFGDKAFPFATCAVHGNARISRQRFQGYVKTCHF